MRRREEQMKRLYFDVLNTGESLGAAMPQQAASWTD
jgi:hypothetical protein